MVLAVFQPGCEAFLDLQRPSNTSPTRSPPILKRDRRRRLHQGVLVSLNDRQGKVADGLSLLPALVDR